MIPGFTKLRLELRSLASSLVCLRNLQHIAIVDRNVQPHDSFILSFPTQSQRIPAPDAPPGSVELVNGTIILSTGDGRDASCKYCGVAGRLPSEEVARLKAASDWPQVVQRAYGQTSANRPVKGEPHFATLIAWASVQQGELVGSLDVRWCVFFPVGKQPPGKSVVTMAGIRRHVTINLHGFFFLDSERLRIDGLEEQFKSHEVTAIKSCLEWNRVVATRGTLARLPQALASFAEQDAVNNVECRELAEAIRQTWVWSSFHEAICHFQTWRPRWRSGTEKWECHFR